MKYLFRIAITILLVSLLILPASALTIPLKPTDRFFVNDFADVISDEDENAIYATGVQLYEKTQAQVVAVTVQSLDGADISDYGTQLGRAWGIGEKEKNTGVVLLLSVGDRQINISVGYGLEGAITDAKSGILLDHYAIPYLSDDDFSVGMQKTYDAIVNEIYLEFGMESDPDYTPADDLPNNDLPSFIVMGVMALMFFVVLPIIRRRRPGFFFWMPGGFGGFHDDNHHSGGFGGGGRFGGGGGSFGGGGASRGF